MRTAIAIIFLALISAAHAGSLETLKGKLEQDSGKYILSLPDAYTLKSGGQSISSKRLQVEGWTVADIPKLNAAKGNQIKLTGYVYPGTPAHVEKLVISVTTVPGDTPIFRTVIINPPTVAATPMPVASPVKQPTDTTATNQSRADTKSGDAGRNNSSVIGVLQNTTNTVSVTTVIINPPTVAATPIPVESPVKQPTDTTATSQSRVDTKSGDAGKRDSSLIGLWENITNKGYDGVFTIYITLNADGTAELVFSKKDANSDIDAEAVVFKNWRLEGDRLVFQNKEGGEESMVIVERHQSSFTIELWGNRFNMTRKRK